MNIREFVVEHTKEIGLPIRTIKFCLLELIVRRNRETIVHYSKKSQYEIFLPHARKIAKKPLQKFSLIL